MQGPPRALPRSFEDPELMTVDVAAPVPLWLLYEDEVDALARGAGGAGRRLARRA